MSLQAYQRTQRTVETPRDTEYRLFSQVTRALFEAEKLPRTDPRVIAALDWNRRMWATFSSDCSSPDNKLPDKLRAQIISIGLWVSRYSSQVMRNGVSVSPLIDVNRSIMQGLEQKSTG
jgi:flagellar protein FlaF